MGTGRQFLLEIRRRNVLRAAMLYAGAVWAFGQGLSQFSPTLGLPDWVTRWFLIAAVIGFPFWVAFAWFYELTPHGFKRESEVAADAPIRHSNARRLDFAIIAVLVVAVVLLGSGYFVRRHPPASQAEGDFAPPGGTLVVLPFKNLSGDPTQQYFSDGISEELTGALGRNPALSVIAWDTASKFRDSRKSAMDIGRELNVAHVLSGNIERAGAEVRVSVELTNAVTGYEVWSHHYDDSFADIFSVQDRVSRSIANALEVRFSETDLPAGGTHNPQAHELVLKSLRLMGDMDAASLAAARSNLEQALKLDPDYADAHAMLAQVLLGLTQHANLPLATAIPEIRSEAERALAIDPRNANALLALGLAYDNSTPRQIDKAKAEFVQAIAIDPSNNAARTDYALDLPLKEARAEVERVAGLDPDDAGNWNNLAVYNQDMGDWPQVIDATRHLLHLAPSYVFGAFYLANAYQQMGQHEQSVQAFDLVKPATELDKRLLETGRLVYQAAQSASLRPKAIAALRELSQQNAANQDVAYNVMQMYLALDDTTPALHVLQGYCKAVPVACSDLAINPVYTPLRSNATFLQLARQYTTIKLD